MFQGMPGGIRHLKDEHRHTFNAARPGLIRPLAEGGPMEEIPAVLEVRSFPATNSDDYIPDSARFGDQEPRLVAEFG